MAALNLKTGESGNRGDPVYQSDVRRLHHRQAGGFPHYRYYLFHRCDDLKYAVPDAFECHYRCDECDTFLDRSSVRYRQRSWYS